MNQAERSSELKPADSGPPVKAELLDFGLRLQEFDFASVDYQYIADRLLDFTGATAVAINFIDEAAGRIVTRAVAASEGVMDKLVKTFHFLGLTVIGQSWPANERTMAKLKLNRPLSIENLFELFCQIIPRSLTETMARFFRIGSIYGIGLVHRDQLLGSAIVLFREGCRLEQHDAVGAIARQVGAVIWRKKLESELLESRERYRSLIDNTRDLVLVADPDLRWIEANPAAAELLGYARAELLAMKVTDIVEMGPEEIQRQKDQLKIKGAFIGEYGLKPKAGPEVCVEICGSRLPDGNCLWIGRNLTERKQAEEQLLQARKLEAIGILAGGIAHEFNNLLARMLANVQVMEVYHSQGKSLTKYFNGLKESIDRAAGLAGQFLTFSSGGFPIKQPVSIPKLMTENATAILREAKAIQYRFQYADALWPVTADRVQLNEALRNVIINAMQAMPRGGLLSVAASNFVQTENSPGLRPGDYVRITIADTGIGIPETNLPRIFDPFFTTKPDAQGLGLTISYSIIKKHSGIIEVKSRPGNGSSFEIYLPAEST